MRLSHKLVILGLGCLTAMLVTGGWLSGYGGPLERWALDWGFRWTITQDIRDDLIHVDIDDLSIERLGRWPWPRQQIAGIIETLHAAGAESIALDVLFPEPQPIRYVSESQGLYGTFEKVLHEGVPQVVMDDAELAHSIHAAGNVVLAMHGQFTPLESLPYEGDIKARIEDNPAVSFRQLALELTGSDPESPMADEIKDRFHQAYLRVCSRIALEPYARRDLEAPQARIIAPLHTLLRNARDVGFVTIDPDEDGILRRIRLLGNDGGLTYTQLALSLALHRLQADYHQPMTVRRQGDQMLIYAGTELVRRIDMDGGGMLINWALRPAGQSHRSHGRISAGSVAKVWMEKQRLADLDTLDFALKVKWLSLGRHIPDNDTQTLYWTFMDQTALLDQVYTQRIGLQRQDYFDRLYDPCQLSLTAEIQHLQGQEQQIERQRYQGIDTLFARLSPQREAFFVRPDDPADPNGLRDYEQRVRQADDIQALLEQLPQVRADLESNLAQLHAELAERVAGRICLVGSTATAAADFVPTPLQARTPGIDVHASIYDTIVSGQIIRSASGELNLALILIAGLIVTLLAMRFNAAVCGPLMVGLAVLYTAFYVFVILPQWHLHVVLASPLVTMLMVFMALTVFKALTEERAKRKIRHLFSRALSSSLVDELMRDPQLANLGGQKRELTCMFSDLAGFTPLSQRLGPQETVKLLNQYFDCVTDVVQTRFGGYINKFLGDGVFALFGAPVTQSDHAQRAVRSAVEYIQAVQVLNQAIPEAGLAVRIGITTGHAMVGNCGSSTRMDYTAIGDCVNLSSRLESANKYFCTHILVEAETWRRSGLDRELLARPLGLTRITGVARPVWITHVAGTLSRHETLIEHYLRFSRGIQQLYDRQYAEAVEVFASLQGDLGEDVPVCVFLQVARQGLAGDFSGEFSGGVVRIVPPWEQP